MINIKAQHSAFSRAIQTNLEVLNIKLFNLSLLKLFILLNCLTCLNGSTKSTMLGFDIYHQNTLRAQHVSGNSIE